MDEKNVFISYKSDEIFEAQCLKELLEKNGISVWMAPMCIVGGSSYAVEIPRAIRGCKVFVLVLSARAQSSKWVSREVDLAINEGKVIMPFMLENCPLKDDFSFYLTNVQRYPAYENKVAAAEKMITDIKSIIGSESSEVREQPQPQYQPQPEPQYQPQPQSQPQPQPEPQPQPQPQATAWQQVPKAEVPPQGSFTAGAARPAGTPNGYTTQYYSSNQNKKKDPTSVFCLVMGILSLLTMGMLIFTEIIAILLALTGVKNLARNGKSDGMVLGGLITGLLGAIIFIAISTFGVGVVPMVIFSVVCLIIYAGQKKKGRNEYFMQMNMMGANRNQNGFKNF